MVCPNKISLNILVHAHTMGRVITRAIDSRISRSMAAAVKLKDAKPTQPKTRTPKYVKILIPGDDNVLWKQKVRRLTGSLPSPG